MTNTPGVLDAAVADLTLGLILACRRHLVASDRFVREGRWRRGWARPELLGRDLEGSTLGLVGLGRIGRQVESRAQAFRMRNVSHRRAGGLPLDELLGTADVVSLHVPLTPETDGLISRERLALLQDGATLVDTARGAIVDEDALVAELVSGRIWAGLDVFAGRAVCRTRCSSSRMSCSPHVASATVETPSRDDGVLVDNVLAFLARPPCRPEVSG